MTPASGRMLKENGEIVNIAELLAYIAGGAGQVKPTNFLYVGKNGSDTEGDGSANLPYLTIQKAIDVATLGTAIYIFPGTYAENITFKAGVYLVAPSIFSVYITGNHIASFTGTVVCANIILNSASGNTLSFTGGNAQNFQLFNSSVNATAGDAINWTNTNANSKILFQDGTCNVTTSGASARCFYSSSTAKGSFIANRVTIRLLDNPNNTCIALGGAVAFTHTSDQIVGRVVVSDSASVLIGSVAMVTTSVSVLHTASTGTVTFLNETITTTATPSVTGTGLVYHVALLYTSTGVGGASTLSGGLGPIGLPMSSIKIRATDLVPSAQILAGLNTGAFEFTGTDSYFTIGATRYKHMLYPENYPSHILYVDNSRTDSYTPDGSASKPYKDVQSAHDAIGKTNYLTDNQNSVETDLTGFTSKLSATLTRDITEHRFGSASLKVVTPGTVSAEGATLTGAAVAASTQYTAEVWVKGSGTATLALQEQTSTGTVVGTTTKAITLTDIWTRYEISRTFGATGVSAVVLLYTATAQATTFYADGFRVGLASEIPSSTNMYSICVALGMRYTGTLDIWRDYLTIYGQGATKGAGFKGTINNWSPHLTLQGIHLMGTSSATRDCYFNQVMNGDFLVEFKDCRASYCTMVVSASGTTAQKNNAYVQATGGTTLWQQNTIACTGVNGTLGLISGIHAVNTFTATGCYLVMGCATVDSCITNLEAGTVAEFMGMNAVRNTVNLKTGATLYADINALNNFNNTLNNTGGTLIRVSDAQVFAALQTLKASAISDPSGGDTIDSESRTAINAILDVLQTYGMIATS